MSRRDAEGIKDCRDFFEEYDKRFNPSDVQRNKNMTSEEKYRRRQAVTSMVDVLVGRRRRGSDVRSEVRIG